MRNIRRVNVVLFAFVLVIYPLLSAEIFTARCVGVSDGDTITVLRDKQQIKVRLDGVDAPESQQDFGSRAKQFTSGFVFGKDVTVRGMDRDRYGRLVGRVIVEGKDLSIELVRAGLAWHYRQYSKDPMLASAESGARQERLGVWSMPNPVAPWEFRSPSTSRVALVAETVYHGNVSSHIFHQPSCRYYGCGNCTAEFNSREEAIKAGYRPCKVCKP